MTDDYWFRPKTHGYGAYPLNWKGWAAIAGFIAIELVLVGALIWILQQGAAREHLNVDVGLIALWLLMLSIVTAGFIWLTKRKTDGEWRWRWGKDETG